MTARRLGGAVQGVGRGAPDGIMRCGAVRLQRRLVAIDFVEVVDVRVRCVLEHVEAQTARLIPLGAEGIGLDRLEEPLARVGLDPNLDPHRQHLRLLFHWQSKPTGCPRCGAGLAPRRPQSLAITTALCLAGFILYLPANLFPILTITRFGRSEAYTIIGGVRDLAKAGLWPLALLVLLASIVVPVLKLTGLTCCLVAIRARSAWLLRQRTAFYRFIDYIGRWSNIDVFVVATVAALVQFGNLTSVEPGPGIASFAAVVVLTMIAADAFDPRLMWDAALQGRRR